MNEYDVSVQVYSSLSFRVKANSPEEAEELAGECSEPGICYQCQRQNGYEQEGVTDVEFNVDSIGEVVNVELVDE